MKTSALLVLLLSLGCLLVAQAKKPKARSAGEQVYRHYCENCHSTGKQQQIGPGMYHVLKTNKLSEKQVRDSILNGKDLMPPFRLRLSQAEMDELMAYLKTL
jgi:mono/diheme cytochrome c family protein